MITLTVRCLWMLLSRSGLRTLTASVLYQNGIVGENAVMDAQSLPAVEMPNRHGFVPDPRPDLPSP